MAKITLSPLLNDIRGQAGDYVFRRLPTGDVIMSKKPDMSKVKWSKAQKEQRRRFKEAVAYAKGAMAEPKVRAKYQKRAAKENKRPYDLAISDYFKGRASK